MAVIKLDIQAILCFFFRMSESCKTIQKDTEMNMGIQRRIIEYTQGTSASCPFNQQQIMLRLTTEYFY